MNDHVTKKCPFCGEEINAEAIKCRFCKEFLATQEEQGAKCSDVNNSADEPSPDRPSEDQVHGWNKNGSRMRKIIVIVVISAIAYFAFRACSAISESAVSKTVIRCANEMIERERKTTVQYEVLLKGVRCIGLENVASTAKNKYSAKGVLVKEVDGKELSGVVSITYEVVGERVVVALDYNTIVWEDTRKENKISEALNAALKTAEESQKRLNEELDRRRIHEY